MIEQYDKLITTALRKVPLSFRDDCYQAACVGLLKAHELKDKVIDFRPYAYKCMRNEIMTELAKLSYPIPIDKDTYILLKKYKRYLEGEEVEINLTSKRRITLNRLLNLKRVPLKTVTAQ